MMFVTHRQFLNILLPKCDFTSDLVCISTRPILDCLRATVSAVRPGSPSVGLPVCIVNYVSDGLLMNVIINK